MYNLISNITCYFVYLHILDWIVMVVECEKYCTHSYPMVWCGRLRQFDNGHSLQNHLESHLHRYKSQYGVLLFLYSVILTKVQYSLCLSTFAQFFGWDGEIN